MTSQLVKPEAIPSVEELMYMYEPDMGEPHWQPQVNEATFQNDNQSYLQLLCPPLAFSNVASSSGSISPSPSPSTPDCEDEDDDTNHLKPFINYNPNPSTSDLIQRAGTRKDRRRQQNRLAQKKYRARKERLITDLQGELDGLRRERDAAMQLNARLMMEIRTLRYAFMPGGEGASVQMSGRSLTHMPQSHPQMGMGMMYEPH